MEQKESVQESLATTEEAALVFQLAACAKSYFVYPEKNQRVDEATAQFLSAVTGYSEELKALDLFVRRNRMRSSSGRLDTKKPLLKWFRDCLVKTLVTRVRIEREITRDALLAFLGRLQENCALREREKTRDVRFSDLWPEAYEGLTLEGYSFLGGYHGNTMFLKVSEDGQKIATVRTAVDLNVAADDPMIRAIEISDQILQRVRRVESVLDSKGLEAASEMSLDLLGEIACHLPVEALSNPDYAQSKIEEILESLEPFIAGLVMRTASDDEQKINRLLATVIDDFFGGQSVTSTETRINQKADIVRPGDELVTDDVEACLRELDRLPNTAPSLEEPDPYAAAEALGACLHRLSHCPRDASAKAIYAQLSSLMANPDEESRKILTAYSDLLLGDAERESKKDAEKVFEHLQKSGLLARARELTSFNVDSLVFAFPKGFFLFLDSLDQRGGSDREALADLCGRIGDERIRREEPALMQDDGILRRDRATKLLSCSSPSMLPMARIVARHGGRPLRAQLVKYLMSLEIDRAEAAALRVLEPADRIPEGYLIDLCDGELNGGNYKDNMLQYTGFLIRNYIESLGGEERYLERRAYAILTLKDFPGKDTDALLKAQVKRRGPLGVLRVSKAIRDAVARVRSQLGTRG